MPSPPNNHTAIVSELVARIHPTLQAQLIVIDFERLDPYEVQLIFADTGETVVRELVREMREKHLLP